MHRPHLTTVLASLGLSGACTVAPRPTAEPAGQPELAPAPGLGGEPSGLGTAAKPATPSSSGSPEPHFEGLRAEFCHAQLQPRDEPLLQTESFLAAWNELAPWIHNRLAHNIPQTEIDARISVCGAAQCNVDAPRLTEVQADYMIGVGMLIPGDAGMLVVPEIATAHTAGPCTNTATAEVEHHGRFIHVRAISHDRQYSYAHGHGYAYGEHYEPFPVECVSYGVHRRDLVIDAESGELELIIDQAMAEDERPWVELSFEEPGIVLRGCASALELRWTE